MAHAEIPVGEVTILPLLFPIARAFGVHEVHYAMIYHARQGYQVIRPTLRRRLLCAPGRIDHRRDISMDLDRVLVII